MDLRDNSCQECPPTFAFIDQYRNDPDVGEEVVRQYFEAYPRAFEHEDELMEEPLMNRIVVGHEECDGDLFKWMIEQCPANISKQDPRGCTILHSACIGLRGKPTENMAEICRFLIRKAPALVRRPDNNQTLPIHKIADKCKHRAVQAVVLLLLKEYPESYDMQSKLSFRSVPKSFPFIESVNSYLQEENKLESSIHLVKEVPSNLAKAVSCSKDSIVVSVSEVVSVWANSRLHDMRGRLDVVADEIERIRKEFEEQDEEDIEEDEF